MHLQHVIDQLLFAELKQTYLGETPEALNDPQQRRKLLHVINRGLTELHKRFLLKEGRVLLLVQPDRYAYHLDPAYLEDSTSAEPVKYLRSLEQPFRGGFHSIERVYDQRGVELPLNDLGHPMSLRSPRFDWLYLPPGHDFTELTVVYRDNHPDISQTDLDADFTQVTIDLPPAYLEALLLFVAARLVGAPAVEGGYREEQDFLMRFEAACQQLTLLGLDQTVQDSAPDRFRQGGWV